MKLFVASFLVLSALSADGEIQCRDENNNPVDWYVMYKLPKMSKSSDPLIKKGKGFMFITSSGLSEGWQVSKDPIDSNTTLLANTLPFIVSPNSTNSVLWMVYNDQGNGTCFECGHTKGVVAGDSSGGIWLVHSIPKFLKGTYPPTGVKFGQSALCLSLSKEVLNSVGDLLAYNQAKFREWKIVEELADTYPNIMKAFDGVKVTEPWSLKKDIKTLGGTTLTTFAKAKSFNKDLYEWVASSLETELLAETWINDASTLPSSCSLRFKVLNVESIKVPALSIEFSSHKDHSKVALSHDQFKPWVCIGDINRAESQEKRGGGTACIKNQHLWESYAKLINSTEKCSTYYDRLTNKLVNFMSNLW